MPQLILGSVSIYTNYMNEYDIKRLALILALQAEVEGMKFDNMQREQYNNCHSYTDDDFHTKADELREIAKKPNSRL